MYVCVRVHTDNKYIMCVRYNIRRVPHSDFGDWANLCKSVTDEINKLYSILHANQMLMELLVPEFQPQK